MKRCMATSDRYGPYDIVVVPFPYTDRLAEKRRPALVISDEPLARFGMVWVAMITSARNEPWECDVRISDLERAGLPAASVVRPVKIAAIEPSRIIRRAGSLDRVAARDVAKRVQDYVASAPR
jgi:mRNA interferase MazF